MKHNYLFSLRLMPMVLAVLWLAALSNLASAQQSGRMEPGILRIKVSEQLSHQLETATLSRTPTHVLMTGIRSLDLVHEQYKVTSIQRVFRDGGKFEARHRRHGLHLWYEVKMDQNAVLPAALEAYRKVAGVLHAEPALKKAIIGSDRKDFGPRRVDISRQPAAATLPGPSNDPLLNRQWHYNNTGQAGGTPGLDVALFRAWGLTTGTPNVVVAVTDGGAQVNHPDLAANMWVNTDEIPGNNIDDDNNGYVDDINGYGFGDDTGEIAPSDHGTHTSGTIGAVTNNGIGVAGVAGGSGTGDGVRIMSCAAFGANNQGGFELTYVYGADNGAVISQNSWGYTFPGDVEEVVLEAIDYFIAEAGLDENGNQVGPMRGGIVIFAAGNDDADDEWYPGFYEPTLAVSGLTNKDTKAWYSNFGTWVDIAAPGGETFVANDPQGVLSTVSNSGYAFFQGTSMACPHVSGIAALLVSKLGGPGFTPAMLRQRLTERVTDVNVANPDYTGKLGSGKVNAFAGLSENDGIAPNAVTDLEVTDSTFHSLTISWTAPADANNGSAWTYEISFGDIPIGPGDMEPFLLSIMPVPAPAGTRQSVTIDHLDPAHVYTVTMRSRDFFGNTSAVTAVSGTTGFGPQFEMDPTTTSVTVQTAQAATTSTTVRNAAGEDLIFTITKMVGDLATPDILGDTLAAGDSVVIHFTVDAHNTLPGEYPQVFGFITNEPFHPSHTFVINATVISNGAPIAVVAPDSLAFGPVYVSSSETQLFTIHNDGAEPLVVTSIASNNPVFTTDFAGADTLAAFATDTVYVTFTPTAEQAEWGVIEINTNDPFNSRIEVGLSGEGVAPPILQVSPASLSATLHTGKKETQTLTISNPGGSDLEYAVTVLPAAMTAQTVVKNITLPSRAGAATSRAGLKQPRSAIQQTSKGTVSVKSVQQASVVTKVLILSPDEDVSDLEAVLDAFDDVEADVFSPLLLPGLSATSLKPYDVVLTTNNTQWAAADADAADIGDALAAYVDGGGKVIANSFVYSYDAWRLAGRFIDEQYGPFTPSTDDALLTTSLGTIVQPGHPLMAGVDSLRYQGFIQNVGLAPGAVAIARWANGDLFLAANTSVVALNLLPSFGDGSGEFSWTGDLPTIYQNAIHYLRTSSLIEVNPITGIVPAGQVADLEATFDATGLDSGVYQANIHITSNAPAQPQAIVPATLTVIGPEFSVSPTALSVALEKDQTVTQTLVLTNNTSVSHNYTVSIEAGIATLAPAPVAVTGARRTSTAGRTAQSAMAARGKSSGVGSGKQAVTLRTQDDASFDRAALSAVSTSSVSQYATDFESFIPGDIHNQQGWFGLFSNWTVETENPFAGTQHFRGLSDGFGFTGALSPAVAIGTEAKSTVTMKIDVQGAGVTWQIVPQSASTEFVNTRIQFGADGVMSALIDDGADGLFDPIGTTPSGYFDLTVEVDRDSAYFNVFVNNLKIYTGQGFAGNIEEVAILSDMETAGPTIDVDNLQIFDGEKEEAPEFITVTPVSGILPAGASVALNVTFSSEDIDFGNYSSTINIGIGGTTFKVPASLAVTGEPNIHVSPTVLQDTLAYREDSYKSFQIRNTGGSPLTYNLQVIGANTSTSNLKTPAELSKARSAAETKRIQEKQVKDVARSRVQKAEAPPLQLLAGISLLQENFDGTFPPTGWTTTDNEGDGVVWAPASDYGYDNFAGTGGAATVSSDEAGFAEFDAELITPLIQTAGYRNIAVQYNANYQNLANLDFLDLDIQVNGGDWVNVLSWNEDHGGFFGLPGESVTVELGEYLGTAPASFRLRWHYYDPNTGDFNWYAQIDDVVILAEARAWLNVEPTAGTIPVGGAAEIAAHFDAIESAPGFYVAGILVFSNAAENPLVGVLASLTVLQPAKISVNPSSITAQLMAGEQTTQTLTISNTGQSPLHFDLTDSTHTWLSAQPHLGTVSGGASQAVTVSLDASGLAGGTYLDTLRLVSNDPLKPIVRIPVQLTVIVNIPPVLAAINPLEVPETTTLQVTFTATDADQEAVTVTLLENLSFITKISASNGTARYAIAPKLGDAGEYDLPVIAADARGAQDSAIFHLSVVAYGVESFSLRNVKTNAIIATFEDSVQLDVADPLFYRLAIRANTRPGTVGSVKFWLDGHSLNTENSKPYELTQLAVFFLDGGAHTLKAQAFTKANAKGTKGASHEALVRVVNSSSVTGFDVVKTNGTKVIGLENNGVIDISKSAFRNINIRANVTGDAVKSVVFYLNGRFHRVDNDGAFVLHGNWFGADSAWPAAPGWYTLKAIPYSGWYGLGVAGTPVTIRFRVSNGKDGTATARAADDDIAPGETESVRFSIFPVPVKDELQIAIPRETQGHVRLLIHDAQGKARFTDAGDAEVFYEYSVSTEELKLSGGLYFVQVQYANGVREIRKFMKE